MSCCLFLIARPNPAITTYLHIAQGRATLVMTLFTIGSSIIILMVVLNIVKVFVAVLTFSSKSVPCYQSRLIKSVFCRHITKNLIDCFSQEWRGERFLYRTAPEDVVRLSGEMKIWPGYQLGLHLCFWPWHLFLLVVNFKFIMVVMGMMRMVVTMIMMVMIITTN